MATYAGIAWYSFRLGKSKAEEHRIAPFKEAAEGWEDVARKNKAQLEQVQTELAKIKQENGDLHEKYTSLEKDYLTASRTNFKLQGEVDELKKQVNELRKLVTDAIAESKGVGDR